MPLISIPTKAVDRVLELRAKERKTDSRYDIGMLSGYMKALGDLLPSEVVGCIIMEADCAEMDIPGLPRLVLTPREGESDEG